MSLCVCAGGVAPPLTQLFSVGQYVRCVIKDLGSSGSSGSNGAAAVNGSSSGSSGSKKRVVATLRLKVLLSGLSAAAAEAGGGYFEAGQVVPAVVSGIEDRGYALSLGVKVSSGRAVASKVSGRCMHLQHTLLRS